MSRELALDPSASLAACLGALLRRLRTLQDLSQAALGRLAGYDGTTFTWDPTSAVPDPVAVGDREVVRVRPYMRVAANLSLSITAAANIPPFNPQKLLAEPGASAGASDESPGAAPDAAVSFVTRDLASVLPKAKVALSIPLDEVVARDPDVAGLPQTPRREVDIDPVAGEHLHRHHAAGAGHRRVGSGATEEGERQQHHREAADQ